MFTSRIKYTLMRFSKFNCMSKIYYYITLIIVEVYISSFIKSVFILTCIIDHNYILCEYINI